MIKKLAIFLCIVGMISACDSSESTSGGSGDGTTLNSGPAADTSSSTDTSSATASSSDSSSSDSESACLDGRYEFRTDSDGKKHFDALFVPGGTINYNLNGGPSGTWELSGSTVTIVGPFGANRANATLTFRVTQQGSDCLVTQFRGESLGGAALTVTRI